MFQSPFPIAVRAARCIDGAVNTLRHVSAVLGGTLLLLFQTSASPLRAAERLGPRHWIRDSGARREFEVATNELCRLSRPPAIVSFRPLPSAEAVRQRAETLRRQTGEDLALVLYERGAPRNAFTRRILTRQVIARLAEGVEAARLGRGLGASATRAISGLPGWFRFDSAAVEGALRLAETLRRQPGVTHAEAQLARLHQPKRLPNDPFLPQQWNLLNTGQNGGVPGTDVNVTTVWDTWRGAGVVLAIVDDGLQIVHPDLAPNVNTNLSWDFNFDDPDPSPSLYSDFHGTEVAGLAAARGDNALGVAGVAYEATLVGLRLLGAPDTDEQDAAAMLHSNAVIQVKNNSWGAPDADAADPSQLAGPGPLMIAALDQGTALGRGGLGETYVFAGGNGGAYGDDVNYDGFANSIDVFAVGAVSDQGQQASYSEPGACLVVGAPSGSGDTLCSGGRQQITTTDLVGENGDNYSGAWCELTNLDYTQEFSGTSAATPEVSGVIALLLQAQPRLGYRDVKEILMRSATRIAPEDADWSTNSAGLAHNHKFGAGLLNAGAAIQLATHWLNLDPLTHLSLLQTNLNLPVPDNDPVGVTVAFTVTNTGFRVEQVALTVTLPHQKWGDLAITLVSPGGTQSRLAELHNSAGSGYDGWTLLSVRDWGEAGQGTWLVQIADLAPANTGTLEALQLDFYGSTPSATLQASRSNHATQLVLEAAAAGWTYALETSTNLTDWATLGSMPIGTDGRASRLDASALTAQRFYRARLLP